MLLKTTRSPFATPAGALAERQPGYLAELGLRCAALDSSSGWLVVGYERLTRSEGSIRAYRVRFADVGGWKQRLEARREALRVALQRRDPLRASGLPGVDVRGVPLPRGLRRRTRGGLRARPAPRYD